MLLVVGYKQVAFSGNQHLLETSFKSTVENNFLFSLFHHTDPIPRVATFYARIEVLIFSDTIFQISIFYGIAFSFHAVLIILDYFFLEAKTESSKLPSGVIIVEPKRGD